uniref:Uncharacterized protein n=1 Tax=Panagrolaimus sp. PS1159 TaxID=55785 RepID=A0AC35G6D7_9BILA
MDNNSKMPPSSKAYEEALLTEQEALQKLEELEKEKMRWTKSLEDARKRKEYVSKTRQMKKALSPRRRSTAMNMRSPATQNNAASKVKTDVDKVEREMSPPIPELVYPDGYDPIQCVAPHQVNTEIRNLNDTFNRLFYQPCLPENNVKVPLKKAAESHIFYIYKVPNEDLVRKCIIKLDGIIADSLESATRVVFYPTSKKLPEDELFFLLTAAAGGRFILPVSYIIESNDTGEFLKPTDYSNFDYYNSKHDLDPATLAAIKMSVEIRQGFIKNGNPCFYMHNVLFAEPKGKHEDVILFLRVCGAYVQPYYGIKKDRKNEFVSNFCISLVVNSGEIPLTDNLKCSPITTPEAIKDILWRSRDQYM